MQQQNGAIVLHLSSIYIHVHICSLQMHAYIGNYLYVRLLVYVKPCIALENEVRVHIGDASIWTRSGVINIFVLFRLCHLDFRSRI